MIWWNLGCPDDLIELYRGYRDLFPDIYPMIISSDLFLIELLDGSGYDKIFSGHDLTNPDKGRSWSYWIAGRIYVRFFEDGSVTIWDRNRHEEEFESKENASSEILRRLLILDEESKQ